MKKFCISVALAAITTATAVGQDKGAAYATFEAEALKAARAEIASQRRPPASLARPDGPLSMQPDEDVDSFGKNVSFLGSATTGGVYLRPDCTPDPMFPFAPDDICVVKNPNVALPATVYSHPDWQITIPKNSAKNVFYLLINHTTQAISNNSDAVDGTGGFTYGPRLTLVSSAFNDPNALDPATGQPLNGELTIGLPGSSSKAYRLSPGQFQNDLTSYASVNGRGLSRAYFRAIGLPNNVIDKIYNRDLTIKLAFSVYAQPKTSNGSFFYQMRVMGQ